jgi:hypothetical protein
MIKNESSKVAEFKEQAEVICGGSLQNENVGPLVQKLRLLR